MGFSFSAGFLDFALNFHKANTHRPLLLLLVGVVYFFVYFFVFRFVIRRFNVLTPGREADEDPTPDHVSEPPAQISPPSLHFGSSPG
jgi:PTS system N-acetylglucosamine-specific IIC component